MNVVLCILTIGVNTRKGMNVSGKEVCDERYGKHELWVTMSNTLGKKGKKMKENKGGNPREWLRLATV